jgi:hypothetical protein
MTDYMLYIVQYNDCYGDGSNKMMEILVKGNVDFEEWLKRRNKEREADGEEPEGSEEFTLIPIRLFNPDLNF